MKRDFDAIFIDLDKTIIHYDEISLDDNMMLEWLRGEGVINPEKIYFSKDWHDMEKRLCYLGVTLEEYRYEWRPRFSDIEIEYKKKLLKNKKARLNEGSKEFIDDLIIPLALISNSAPKVVDFMLEQFNLGDKFSYIYRRPYDFEDIKKPNSKVCKDAMKLLGITDPSRIAMIGDSKADMLFAKNSGLFAINLFFEQKHYDLFFHDFPEMHTYFKKIYKYVMV